MCRPRITNGGWREKPRPFSLGPLGTFKAMPVPTRCLSDTAATRLQCTPEESRLGAGNDNRSSPSRRCVQRKCPGVYERCHARFEESTRLQSSKVTDRQVYVVGTSSTRTICAEHSNSRRETGGLSDVTYKGAAQATTNDNQSHPRRRRTRVSG